MAFNLVDDYVGASQIAQVDDVQRMPIGTKIKAFDTTYGFGEFVYMPGVASTIAGSVAALDYKAGTTTLSLVATRGPVGVAMGAIGAGQFGYYQVQGAAVVAVAGAVVAGTPAYSTATAGKVDDAVTAGSLIDGMVFKTADGTPAANFAVAQIDAPSLSGSA